jgi:hypothetical protein
MTKTPSPPSMYFFKSSGADDGMLLLLHLTTIGGC